MSTPDFRKVRFVGPLSVFASEWGEHLLAVGYTPSSATAKLQLAADAGMGSVVIVAVDPALVGVGSGVV